MKRFVLFLICLALAWFTPMVVFGQTLQIVRMDGTVENVQIRTFDTEPKVIPIRPYGLNLKPANVPERRSEFVPQYRPYNPGPVTITNPYYVDTPDPQPSLSFVSLPFYAIGYFIHEFYSTSNP